MTNPYIKEFCRRLKEIPTGPIIEEAYPRVTRLMLDQAIRETAYVLECIATLKSIQELGDCSTCGVKDCQYRPALGKPLRYNCPFYCGDDKR